MSANIILKWTSTKKGNPKETGVYLVTIEYKDEEGNFIKKEASVLEFKDEYWDRGEYKKLKRPTWMYQWDWNTEKPCRSCGVKVLAWAEFPKPLGDEEESEK